MEQVAKDHLTDLTGDRQVAVNVDVVGGQVLEGPVDGEGAERWALALAGRDDQAGLLGGPVDDDDNLIVDIQNLAGADAAHVEVDGAAVGHRDGERDVEPITELAELVVDGDLGGGRGLIVVGVVVGSGLLGHELGDDEVVARGDRAADLGGEQPGLDRVEGHFGD